MVNRVHISSEVWVEVDRQRFSPTRVSFSLSAAGDPVCEVALAIGRSKAGAEQVTDDQRQAFSYGKEVSVWLSMSGNLMPGMPKTPTTVFVGEVIHAGAALQREGEASITFGVRLMHAGLRRLTSGTSVMWPFVSTQALDFNLPLSTTLTGEDALVASSRSVRSTGVWGSIESYFRRVADGRIGGDRAQAFNLKCGIDPPSRNQRLLDALDSYVIPSELKVVDDAVIAQLIARHADRQLKGDLRLLPVVQQLQQLGSSLFFRVVPRRDGRIEIIPALSIYDTEHVEVAANQVFSLSEVGSADRSVGGTMLISSHSQFPGAESFDMVCHLFPDQKEAGGLITTLDAPAWLVSASGTIIDSAENRGLIGNGWDRRKARRSATYQSASSSVSDSVARLVSYGNRFAGAKVAFSTYPRVDIGLHSTVKVDLPNAPGLIETVYGLVESVTMSFDATSGQSSTSIGLAYVRSEKEQRQYGLAAHPFYTDPIRGREL